MSLHGSWTRPLALLLALCATPSAGANPSKDSATTDKPEPTPTFSAPTLLDVQVESMPEVDPAAPVVEQLDIKASRHADVPRPFYSIALRGTLARPDGLDHAYGPLGWTVVEAHDAQGEPMRYQTEGYATPEALLNETDDELYRRVGPTLARLDRQRMSFNVLLRDLEYLTPRFERLAIRCYVMLADDPQALDLDVPSPDASVQVGGAWTLTVEAAGDRQELVLHAAEIDPGLWPLRLELIDADGAVLSTGYRRGTETRDGTMATQWRFSQPTLSSPDTGYRVRIHHAAGLHIKQIDAVLGDVELIDLSAPPRGPQDAS